MCSKKKYLINIARLCHLPTNFHKTLSYFVSEMWMKCDVGWTQQLLTQTWGFCLCFKSDEQVSPNITEVPAKIGCGVFDKRLFSDFTSSSSVAGTLFKMLPLHSGCQRNRRWCCLLCSAWIHCTWTWTLQERISWWSRFCLTCSHTAASLRSSTS